MHRPKVGAEWSSDTTTTKPFFSFRIAVGTFHSCAARPEGAAIISNNQPEQSLFINTSSSSKSNREAQPSQSGLSVELESDRQRRREVDSLHARSRNSTSRVQRMSSAECISCSARRFWDR